MTRYKRYLFFLECKRDVISFFWNVINYMMQSLNLMHNYMNMCMYMVIKYVIDHVDG